METIWLPAMLIVLAIVLVIFGPTRLLNIGAAIARRVGALLSRAHRHGRSSKQYSEVKTHDSSAHQP